MTAGISSMSIYVPPLYLSHDDLADARGIPRDKFKIGLGNQSMAIVPPWDDTVTMAANAAEMAIESAGIDKDEIGLVIVSTETAVDQSKPVSSFIHGLLGLGNRTRVYEIKHACYGGTVAIMNAVNWVVSQHHKGKKALVITSDIARYGLNTLGEPTQGAGAIALIISDKTEFIHFLPGLNAFYSKDVHDFWRPNDSTIPFVDGKYSIECYLEALEFCTNDLKNNLYQLTGKKLYDFVDHFLFHLPFTKMVKKAYVKMLSTLFPEYDEQQILDLCDRDYEEKISSSLLGSQVVGNIYTGSVYMSLMSLLETQRENLIGDNIGIFSYGSGCGAEFLISHIGNDLKKQINNISLLKQIDRRRKISIDEYTKLYSNPYNYDLIDDPAYENDKDNFSRYYFTGVKEHKRQYIKK